MKLLTIIMTVTATLEESVLMDIEDLGVNGDEATQRLQKPVVVRPKRRVKNGDCLQEDNCFQSFVPGEYDTIM